MAGHRPAVVAGVALLGALLALAGHRDRGPAGAPEPPIVITGQSTLPGPAVPDAAAVSRSFLASYVAFVYRRLPASQLPHATAAVRRRVAAERPDPPAAVLAAADPTLTSLQIAHRGRRARATAVIADGAAVYQLTLQLERRPAGWTITDLGETS